MHNQLIPIYFPKLNHQAINYVLVINYECDHIDIKPHGFIEKQLSFTFKRINYNGFV